MAVSRFLPLVEMTKAQIVPVLVEMTKAQIVPVLSINVKALWCLTLITF
jgi:hypothetical protein